MTKGTMRSLLSLAVLLLMVLPAAAAPTGVAGLDVEVQGPSPAADSTLTTTDALGFFSLPGLAPGDYLLVISDPDPDPVTTSGLVFERNLTVPAELDPALLHGRVTSDMDVDVSFDVTASLFDELDLPPVETFTIKLRMKWNSNSRHSNGKLWVFVRGADVGQVENVILSAEEGARSIEAATMKTNDELTKLMAEFSKRDAYETLVPPEAVRGDPVEITVSVVTPAGTQDEIFVLMIQGKK